MLYMENIGKYQMFEPLDGYFLGVSSWWKRNLFSKYLYGSFWDILKVPSSWIGYISHRKGTSESHRLKSDG